MLQSHGEWEGLDDILLLTQKRSAQHKTLSLTFAQFFCFFLFF
jgi:hypothetical protein